jgi:hypothetical protein
MIMMRIPLAVPNNIKINNFKSRQIFSNWHGAGFMRAACQDIRNLGVQGIESEERWGRFSAGMQGGNRQACWDGG